MFSLISYSASADTEFVSKGGSKDSLPSQTRKVYGLVFEKISPKLLHKASIRCLLTEREDYQVIPVDVKHIELLKTYNITFCIQKAVDFCQPTKNFVKL